MLVSVLTAVGAWLVYQKWPSKVGRIALLAVILLVPILTAWVGCQVVFTRDHIAANVTQVIFAPACWPFVVRGLYDSLFHEAIFALFVGGPPLGVLTSGYWNDQSPYLPFFAGASGILMGALSLLASVLTLLVLRKVNRVSPFIHARRRTASDEGGAAVPQPMKLVAKADRRVQRVRTALVAVSLLLLIVGAGCVLAPVRVPADSVFREFKFAPLVSNDVQVSIPFTMTQTAAVTVTCNATASDKLWIWLGYEARFEIPFFGASAGGTLTLWQNRTRVEFTFGLENVSLFLMRYTPDPVVSTLFLNTIWIEVYYSGPNPGACNVSICVSQNPYVVPGLVITGVAAVPVWCLVGLVWRQYEVTRRKLAELTIGSENDMVD